jgi:flagellar motor switch protein FliM
MSEQILSQEEIDALLSSMSKGEVDLEEEKKADVDLEVYDLTSQNISFGNQFPALEEIYDKFSNLLSKSLSASLQRSIEVAFISTEVLKFGEYIKDFNNPTSFNIFSMDPLIGSAMLSIQPNLVFSLIDCMFGGDGKPFAQMREFTLIEQRMIGKFAVEVLRNLEQAWEPVFPVQTDIRKKETKPDYVRLVAPDELIISVVFSIEGAEFSGNINLCISYLMLEPIRDNLSSRSLKEKEMENAWSSQLKDLIRDTEVTVIAELGRSIHTVRDLLNLQVEDVLKLNTSPQDLITVNVEEVPKYQGFPGVVKGNRAVQITKLLR